MSGMTTVFADALAGGDVKKFNENMKKGLYTEKDLAKVAAHMKTLVSSEQLASMLKAPDKVVQRMINAWGNLLMELNKAGFWDALSSGIEQVTAAIEEFAPKVKYAYGVISGLVKFAWDNKEVLLTFALGWKALGAAVGLFASAKAAGNIMTMAGTFKVLGRSMVTAFMAPLAAIAAVMLALDTYEAYTQKKRGIIADFRPNPEKDKEKVTAGQADAQSGLVGVLSGIQNNTKVAGGAEALNQSLMGFVGHSSGMTPEMKHNMAERVRRIASPEMLQYRAIPSLLKQLDAAYVDKQSMMKSSDEFRAAGGLSSPTTINVTIQNTEPNVSKAWLVDTMPSVIGDALRGHIKKEQQGIPAMIARPVGG